MLSLNNLITITGIPHPHLSDVTSSDCVVHRGSWNFTSQLFEGLTLCLRDQKSREATAKHEESKDLHDMVEPRRG